MTRGMNVTSTRATRTTGAWLLLAGVLGAGAPGCKRAHRQRVTNFVPPSLPAGFVPHTGVGWRVAAPSTWKETEQKEPAVWAVVDPQTVDEFHANVSVVTEPFTSDSYDYARANEAALRQQARATVEISREDVVDGDPTLVIESRWQPSPPTNVGYRTMQTALASRGQGYVVTCSVSLSAFERYRSTCESIVHQFAVER